MIASGDPIALSWFEAFDQVPMPNLRLSAKDIAGVVSYMETETRRIASIQVTDAVIEEMKEKVEPGASCCQKGGQGTVTDKKPRSFAQAPVQQINVWATTIFLCALSSALGLTVSIARGRQLPN